MVFYIESYSSTTKLFMIKEKITIRPSPNQLKPVKKAQPSANGDVFFMAECQWVEKMHAVRLKNVMRSAWKIAECGSNESQHIELIVRNEVDWKFVYSVGLKRWVINRYCVGWLIGSACHAGSQQLNANSSCVRSINQYINYWSIQSVSHLLKPNDQLHSLYSDDCKVTRTTNMEHF